MKLMCKVTLLTVLPGLLFTTANLKAQGRKTEKEATWYDGLTNRPTEVQPQKLQLLSLQVSRLPRDTFGNAKSPVNRFSLSSFLAASGTGVYGTFTLNDPGTLLYENEPSLLVKFRDNRGTDLTRNPGEEKINDFFEANKPLVVRLSGKDPRATFIVRGYSAPARGAESINATAHLFFLSMKEVKSASARIPAFQADQQHQIGPVSFTVMKPINKQLVRTGRTVNESFGRGKREWVFTIKPRLKPLKNIELLNAEGEVIKTINGPYFHGASFQYFLEPLKEKPTMIRVNWFEKWKLLRVPLKIDTPLGI